MSTPPSLIFVPGAWHRPETWNRVVTELEPLSFTCIAVTLPSTTGNIELGFGDDVKAVQAAIQKETSQGRDVVLVVHSYGGHVGSSAIQGFAQKSHTGSAFPDPSYGHVIGLAIIASGFNVTGLAFLDGIGGKPPPTWVADTDAGLATIVVDARDMMYHDLSEEEGNAWVGKLTKQSLKALSEGGEYAYSGWKDVPCWYLVTADDHAYAGLIDDGTSPAQVQHLFVKMARDAGADVTVREVDSSHSPMLSQPKATAEFIKDAAADFANRMLTNK